MSWSINTWGLAILGAAFGAFVGLFFLFKRIRPLYRVLIGLVVLTILVSSVAGIFFARKEKALRPDHSVVASSVLASKSSTDLSVIVAEQPLPVWNTWLERADESPPNFMPIGQVAPGERANLIAELSTRSYATSGGFVFSQTLTSESLTKIASEGAQPIISVLAVPSDKYFWPLTDQERVQRLTISLTDLQKALAAVAPPNSSNALQFLRTNKGNASFSIGRVAFHLRTRQVTEPVKAGIALFFWVEDGATGAFPIGSMALSLCITSDQSASCPDAAVTVSTFEGPLQVMAAHDLAQSGGYPDAALTVAELDPDSAVGVFYCRQCVNHANTYLTWNIGRSTSSLAKELQNQSLTYLESAVTYPDKKAFQNAGESIFRLVFGDNQEASTYFSDWVKALAANQEHPPTKAPTLFVRLLQPANEERFILPLNLMAVPSANGPPIFLGSVLEVESPLESEDYETGATCLDSWALLVPPANIRDIDAQLADARIPFAQWIEQIEHSGAGPSVFDDVGAFDSWVKQSEQTRPTTLVTLAHHDASKLYFNGGTMTPAIPAVDFQRKFGAPSLAVVDSCGAAKPGAFELVRQLNVNANFETIVASTTLVEKTLGGKFLAGLMDVISANQDLAGIRVGDAVFFAEQRVSQEERIDDDGSSLGPYGPAALLFSVLGNGNLRVCYNRAARQVLQLSPAATATTQPRLLPTNLDL